MAAGLFHATGGGKVTGQISASSEFLVKVLVQVQVQDVIYL